MYYEKYIKYKLKYYKLKYGGKKVNDDIYLYHGTSLMYMKYILENGLIGMYPIDLLEDLKYIWENIRIYDCISGKAHTYVPWFFTRQYEYQKDKTISISFTGNYTVAKEYASPGRLMGEGPGLIINDFKYCMPQNKILSNDKKLKQLLNKWDIFSKMPGVILAIKKSELNNLNVENKLYQYILDRIKKSNFDPDIWEQPINFPIPKEILYIATDPETLIKLDSDEGKKYINDLLEKFPLENKTTVLELICNIISSSSIPDEAFTDAGIVLTTDEIIEYQIDSNGKSLLYDNIIFKVKQLGYDKWNLIAEKIKN
jgi:hypothetical protein